MGLWVPTLPHVEAVADPSTGSAALTWYADPWKPRTSDRIILTMSSAPWHESGVQPFAWDFLPATSRHNPPFFRIAVPRGTTVTQEVGPRGREQVVRVGSSPESVGLVPNVPIVVFHRCQDDGLLSDPEAPLDWHSILGQPVTIGPQDRSNTSLAKIKTLQVTPGEASVSFQQIEGAFYVQMTLSDPGKPAAFCYDVNPDVHALSPVIAIVHTKGVDINVSAYRGNEDFLEVYACEVSDLDQVPPQGVALGEKDFDWQNHGVDHFIPGPASQVEIFLFELGINFIPIVGILYDVGQCVYAAATGKSFFGYDVDEEQLALMGFTTALGLGLSARGALRSLRSVVQGRALAAATDAAILAEIKQVADTGFVEAVGQLTPRQLDDLTRALVQHLSYPKAFPLLKLVTKFNAVIESAYLSWVEGNLMSKVFKADYSGFRDAELAAEYNSYRAQKKFVSAPESALDPAAWAKRQAAAIRGRPFLLLRRTLGEDFVQVINRAERANVLPRRLTPTDITNYDRLAGRVEDYGSLRNAAAKMPGFGDNFEIDHLLEQRFYRNNPSLTTAFDEKGIGMAFVVPKNAAVAREMEGFAGFGGSRIRYVHTLKTRMLRDLIPYGAESFATVQEIWDAHAHVLDSLGLDRTAFTRLAKDFEAMATETGQSFSTRVPSAEAMQHANGWPRFVQDDTGAWVRVVTR